MTTSTSHPNLHVVGDAPLVQPRVPVILHHDDNGYGEIDRVSADYEGDGRDDLIVCAKSCVGILDFGGEPGPGFHPVIEGYDAGGPGEHPVNVTVIAHLEQCGTKARLSAWPRFVTRAVAMVGLFKVWTKERAIRVLIRQSHAIYVLNRCHKNHA